MPGTLTVGDVVVDFELDGIDGARYSTAVSRKDRLQLLAFWKQSCGTCRFTFPFLQRFQEEYAGDGFAIWGVSQEDVETTREFVKNYGATFPQLIDGDLAITEQYGLITVPSLYVVDSTGKILRHASAFVKDELNEMAKLAAERSNRPYVSIVRPEDDAPDIKPG